MRRLPVYFLLDVSDSMAGTPISMVHSGLETIVGELRNDPYALETVFLSILVFAGKARELTPLEELIQFRMPKLPVGPGTNLGAGLELLMDCIDRDVRKTTIQKKGDWKPIIFLFTDGAPTENPASAVKRWQKDYRSHVNMIAVTLGNRGDPTLLEKIANHTLNLANTSPEAYREFFQWVSGSLQMTSEAVGELGNDGLKLAKGGISLEKAKPEKMIGENFAVLPIRCGRARRLWLARYTHEDAPRFPWRLDEACPVDEDYFNLAADQKQTDSIDLADADIIPQCPVCKQSTGVVRCGRCGNLSCLLSQQSGECPWCGLKYDGVRAADSLKAVRSKG